MKRLGKVMKRKLIIYFSLILLVLTVQGNAESGYLTGESTESGLLNRVECCGNCGTAETTEGCKCPNCGNHVSTDLRGEGSLAEINANRINSEKDSSDDPIPERPSVFSYVYDYTFETMNREQLSSIAEEGDRLARTTGVQAIVLVVKSFGTYSANEYATNVINRWGIGSSERNDGIVLVLAVEDRLLEIGTGSGIDTILNNRIANEILDANIGLFAQGKFGDGLVSTYHDISEFLISLNGK